MKVLGASDLIQVKKNLLQGYALSTQLTSLAYTYVVGGLCGKVLGL